MYILHNRRVFTKSAACQLFWSPIETDGAWREVGELDLIQNISFLLTWEVKQSGVRARVAKGACSSDHASTTLKIHQNLFAKVKRKKNYSAVTCYCPRAIPVWGNFQKSTVIMHLSGHAYGLILAKLLFIHNLLLLQKCVFLLLKLYCHLEKNIFQNIPDEHYVSNNNKPWFQTSVMLPHLDMVTVGSVIWSPCVGKHVTCLSIYLVFPLDVIKIYRM